MLRSVLATAVVAVALAFGMAAPLDVGWHFTSVSTESSATRAGAAGDVGWGSVAGDGTQDVGWGSAASDVTQDVGWNVVAGDVTQDVGWGSVASDVTQDVGWQAPADADA
ncbi:hypothetical protein C4B68_18665 [Streptomyces dengpaensis]|uniref:5'-nucleotidase n=2 Tax=Streptomyces TaxID=1883 RepID=A0ABN5I377_9ACTN|nr:hypothetical protein C4B68_18665 [Streptomyces dengpaensis]PIB05592.1 hypothetical protein B1C81_28635 [Streptomyces sp. HG99]